MYVRKQKAPILMGAFWVIFNYLSPKSIKKIARIALGINAATIAIIKILQKKLSELIITRIYDRVNNFYVSKSGVYDDVAASAPCV